MAKAGNVHTDCFEIQTTIDAVLPSSSDTHHEQLPCVLNNFSICVHLSHAIWLSTNDHLAYVTTNPQVIKPDVLPATIGQTTNWQWDHETVMFAHPKQIPHLSQQIKNCYILNGLLTVNEHKWWEINYWCVYARFLFLL